MRQKIEYTDELTGTIADAGDQNELGVPYSPLQRMWQVNPGAEAVEPSDREAKQKDS
ncbi:hypothetical protein [Brevibacillus migulae]|uniref:hypothetical protein n=1 Tax=Brevibacillus migulae TaxID=1644114 RepID=UPI0014317291|nr:hypothetical protein [Brevibacillus migulae]